MGVRTILYKAVLKRTSTFTVVILASAFFFERTFDIASDNIFHNINKGKLWDDIKHNYEKN